jgi:uncharacterized membrane protein
MNNYKDKFRAFMKAITILIGVGIPVLIMTTGCLDWDPSVRIVLCCLWIIRGVFVLIDETC